MGWSCCLHSVVYVTPIVHRLVLLHGVGKECMINPMRLIVKPEKARKIFFPPNIRFILYTGNLIKLNVNVTFKNLYLYLLCFSSFPFLSLRLLFYISFKMRYFSFKKKHVLIEKVNWLIIRIAYNVFRKGEFFIEKIENLYLILINN